MNLPIFSRTAERDIRAIWKYIATDSLKHADLVVEATIETCFAVAKSPMIGHSRLDLTKKDVLFVGVARYDRYLIAYKKSAKGVRIVRVLHGARDIPKIFG